MIVNMTANGWEIIYHRAHALLAAQIAGHWNRENCPIRFYETIAAISHHDDLEREWEENQLTPAGTPLDFTLDQNTCVEKLRTLTTNAQYRGRWVAMLISMHMSFLNEGKRGESDALDRFLDEQLENQKKWREGLNIAKEEAEQAYAFFRWCDRLSLILCQRKLPMNERALEITKDPDDTRYDVLQLKDGRITVKPWPFLEEKFTVDVEACYLREVTFENNDAVKKAMQTAPIKVLNWNFVKL